MKRIAGILSLLTCLAVFAGCAQVSTEISANTASPKTRSAQIDIEAEIKARTLPEGERSEAATLGIEVLTVGNWIEAASGGSNSLVYPVSLCLSRDDDVYISDNNAHAIRFRKRDGTAIQTLSQSRATEARLVWPNAIRCLKESLFVTDNDGIKIYKLDGVFQRMLRTYYAINEFAVAEDGTFYINPAFRTQNASNPLIVALNQEGTKVREFGDRLNNASSLGLDDEAYLATWKNLVLVVFKHRPTVQLYQSDGKLHRTFEVNHPIFSALKSLHRNPTFTNPSPNKYRLPAYVAGISVVENRLLILLHLPMPEIVEFDMDGREIARYRTKLKESLTDYRGFDAYASGGTYYFLMIAGKPRALALIELTGKRLADNGRARAGNIISTDGGE